MNKLDSATVAAAIELVLSARFVPGQRVADEQSDDDSISMLGLTRAIAARQLAATGAGAGARMRVFQKAGISSGVVAQALRAGVLVAVQGDA